MFQQPRASGIRVPRSSTTPSSKVISLWLDIKARSRVLGRSWALSRRWMSWALSPSRSGRDECASIKGPKIRVCHRHCRSSLLISLVTILAIVIRKWREGQTLSCPERLYTNLSASLLSSLPLEKEKPIKKCGWLDAFVQKSREILRAGDDIPLRCTVLNITQSWSSSSAHARIFIKALATFSGTGRRSLVFTEALEAAPVALGSGAENIHSKKRGELAARLLLEFKCHAQL